MQGHTTAERLDPFAVAVRDVDVDLERITEQHRRAHDLTTECTPGRPVAGGERTSAVVLVGAHQRRRSRRADEERKGTEERDDPSTPSGERDQNDRRSDGRSNGRCNRQPSGARRKSDDEHAVEPLPGFFVDAAHADGTSVHSSGHLLRSADTPCRVSNSRRS
jgi:hypothetical protein